MPNKIALHDDPDFDALLAAAAEQANAPLSVVIKDYWLTEALAVLAHATDFRVIFKGGTSLSKGWRLIDRFSEDIDLLVAPPKDGARLGQAASETLLKKVLKAFENGSMFMPSTDPARKPTGGKKPPRRASYFRYPAEDSITSRLGSQEHMAIKQSIREIDELYGVQKPLDFYVALGSSPAFAFGASLLDGVSRRYDAERIYYGRKPPFSEIVKRITVMRGRF